MNLLILDNRLVSLENCHVSPKTKNKKQKTTNLSQSYLCMFLFIDTQQLSRTHMSVVVGLRLHVIQTQLIFKTS